MDTTPLALALDRMISGTRRDPPSRFSTTVAEAALLIGATASDLYVQDYAQQVLVHVDGDVEHPIADSAAGQCFRTAATLEVGAERAVQLWVALRDGSERLGVLGLVFPAVDADVRALAERFAAIVAETLLSRSMLTDLFARRRRTKEMVLAAEMQWELLPPLSMTTDDFVVAGMLEPAYQVGGDAFDYAYDDVLRLAVFDAMGHGVQAALTASVAVNAYRHARRSLLSLNDTYEAVDQAVSEHRRNGFATAIMAELQPGSGRLRWLNAGHPSLAVLRDGSIIDVRPPPPLLPCGMKEVRGVDAFGDASERVAELTLEPGDVVVIATDGVPEQPNEEGALYGEKRLAAVVASHLADGSPVEETLRLGVADVLSFGGSKLRDDATIVLLSYRRHAERLPS